MKPQSRHRTRDWVTLCTLSTETPPPTVPASLQRWATMPPSLGERVEETSSGTWPARERKTERGWCQRSVRSLYTEAHNPKACGTGNSVLCGSLDRRGVWGRMDTCICTAESLHCSPETIITFLIGYTQYKIKSFKTKFKKSSFSKRKLLTIKTLICRNNLPQGKFPNCHLDETWTH